MELRAVLRAIGRNTAVIVVTVLVALAAAVVLSLVIPRTYETETKVLLVPTVQAEAAGSGGGQLLLQANQLLASQAPTYAALAVTPAVLDPAIASSGVDVASTDLVDDVDSALEGDTSIVTLTVRADTAEGAARLANAIAASLIRQVEGVSGVVAGVQISGRVVQAPEIPDSPAVPNLPLNLAVALSAGLLVALLVVAVRESLRATAPER